MSYQSFEELEVWKRACNLAVEVYFTFKDSKEYGLKDQMNRAAVSIPSNIAEGSERNTNPDFIRFLHIAKGSSAELRTQLYIAEKIGILKTHHYFTRLSNWQLTVDSWKWIMNIEQLKLKTSPDLKLNT